MSATSVHNDDFKVFCLEFFHTLWSYDHWIHFCVTVNSHKRESMIRFGEQMKYNRNSVVFMSMFLLPPIKGYSGFCCILLELVKGTFNYKQNKYFFSEALVVVVLLFCVKIVDDTCSECVGANQTRLPSFSLVVVRQLIKRKKIKSAFSTTSHGSRQKQTNTISSGNNSETCNRHSQGLKITVNMDNSN